MFSRFFILFLISSFGLYAQATITIEVNWPNWSSENRVTFRDPSNSQIGLQICDLVNCFDGSGDTSFNNIGSLATYSGIAYGTGFSLYLEDTFGDGWNGCRILRARLPRRNFDFDYGLDSWFKYNCFFRYIGSRAFFNSK